MGTKAGGLYNVFVLTKQDYYGDYEILVGGPVSYNIVSIFDTPGEGVLDGYINYNNNVHIITNVHPNI